MLSFSLNNNHNDLCNGQDRTREDFSLNDKRRTANAACSLALQPRFAASLFTANAQ